MTQKITLQMDGDHHFAMTKNRKIESLNPKELLLYATADCAGQTILSMLKEHSSSLVALEVSIEGTLTTPTVVAESMYSHFNITYRAECTTTKDQIVISRAINLAHDKYCGMIQMLRRIAPLSHDTSIVTVGNS
jgi:putative redox protein